MLLLLALCGSAVQAEVPVAPQPRRLGVADGLPSANINAFAEDRTGYLWLASRDGLARFDGRSHRIWRAEDGIRDNLLWSLHVDARNQLWFGTQSAGLGVLSADRRSIRFFNRKSHPEIGSNTVWSIASTPDGSVWFGTPTAGLHRLASDGSIQRFMPEPGRADSLPSAAVAFLAVTADGVLWVGTKGGLARWTGHGFQREGEDVLPSTRINGLKVDRQQRLWIGTTDGVVVRRRDGRFVSAGWPGLAAGDALGLLAYAGGGDYWLDTRDGLGYSRRGGAVRNVPLYSAQERGLVKPNWNAAHEDRDGGLWFASTNAGLWHLPPSWRQFSVLTRHLDDPASLRNPYALALAASSSGGLWVVGTRGALDRLDPATGAVEHHLQPIADIAWPQSVAEDARGRVWIGSLDTLVRYDPRDRSVRRWHRDDAEDAALAGDGDIVRFCDGGRVWVYSEDAGLQQRDGEGRVLRQIAPGQAGLPSVGIEDMQCGPQDRLWISGAAGLAGWDPGAARLRPVPGGPEDPVYAFSVDAGGAVWTAGQGHVERYRWKGGRLVSEVRIGGDHGFPVLAPGGLVVDDHGLLWASAARGLIRVDPASHSVRLYGVHDGLPDQEFRRRSLVRARDGQVAGGTPEGVVLFDPAQVRPPPRKPPLVIERMSVRRGDDAIELSPGTALQLRDSDRDLQVVARLLAFADPTNNAYRFRLAGYDLDWVDAGASGERVFARLAPGSYTLQVQGSVPGGGWIAAPPLQIEVAPAWWRGGWAKAGYGVAAVLALGGLVLAYRARLRRRSEWQLTEQRRALAEQSSMAKTRFLATFGHEVRTPMTGVLGMTELLLDTPLDSAQRRYANSIQQAGTHLLQLVNDSLDLARIEAGRLELDSQAFELAPLLEETAALIAPVVNKRGLMFVHERRLPMPVLVTGDAMRLRQILMNLLGNAVKFTEHGQVGMGVELLPEGRGIRLQVSDTGPGIRPEQQARLFRRFEQAEGVHTTSRYGGSGLGLAICQELAVAMGGRIRVASRLGAGARFIVELPLPWRALDDGRRRAPPAAGSGPDGSLRILLVEDDLTVADVIAGLLRARGHQVVHALHGLAALAEVTAWTFDVGLLDLDLPGLDGMALATQLRGQGHRFALVAVTARTDPAAELQARAAGFDGFLRKPVTGDMLVAAIGAAWRPAPR
ncbi:response regulator [Stenotrophomonas sp. CPCC 101365]|uniref:histidine kinase n=1 Tax=Stenotrophomonas mori TaxID=2871096 RepID=A0ABT0SDP5_9GAMM|nr:ATP-binding protein [Stenotrophomonas mori]MCL7713454.1 response regulator [Stenotrophomonas mori]